MVLTIKRHKGAHRRARRAGCATLVERDYSEDALFSEYAEAVALGPVPDACADEASEGVHGPLSACGGGSW